MDVHMDMDDPKLQEWLTEAVATKVAEALSQIPSSSAPPVAPASSVKTFDPNDPTFTTWISERVALAVAASPTKLTPPPLRLGKPTKFTGRREDAMDIHAWLFGLDTTFNAYKITADSDRIIHGSSLLDKIALDWWRYEVEASKSGGPALPSTWAEWCALIVAKFEPINAERNARDKMASLRQTGSVTSFAIALQNLMLKTPSMHADDRKHRFIQGLKPHIQRELSIREPVDLREAVNMAERIDAVTYRPSSSVGRASSSTHGPQPMELGALAESDDERDEDVGDEWDEDDEDAYQLAAATVGNAAGRRPAPLASRRASVPIAPRRGAPLTSAQKKYARDNGLCWSCMKPGHPSAQCPDKIGHPKGGAPPA